MIAVFLVIFAVLVFCILFAFTKPKQIGNLRPRGGFRLKNGIGTLMIKGGRKKNDTSIDSKLTNARVPVPTEQSETQYNDSFVFHGSDTEGGLFLTRLGFRDGGKEVEVWIWMILQGKKYFNSVQHIVCDPPDRESISGGGLSYRCTDMEEGIWQIAYQGELSPGVSSCSVELTYKPDSLIYDSGVHMDPAAFARAMAEMKWSKEFFSNLRSENQRRIEQGGLLTGTISLDGAEHKIAMKGVRDHSWGKRDWAFINRYIWNVLSLNDGIMLNGEKYKYLCYTTVNYGTTFKCLVSGWISGDEAILPIVAASDQAEIGEDGNIPGQFQCFFQPRGCRPLKLSVRRSQPEQSWIMADGSFEVCEAFCSFEIEGEQGVGMSEFGYSKQAGYENRF